MKQPTRSEVGAELDRLLADGQWHSYELIMSKVMVKVPPGRAVRRSERRRQFSGGMQKAHLRSENRKVPRALEDQIRIGQRAIVRDIMRKRCEVYPTGRVKDPSTRKIRLRTDA